MIAAEINEIRKLSNDVILLQLKPERPLSFQAGQHLIIQVPDGPSRCYSLASSMNSTGLLDLHIRLRCGGAFSDHALNTMQHGDRLYIHPAQGDFLFPEGNNPIVMLATGTGIAPFLAMLQTYLPTCNGRELKLYWGGRVSSDFYASEILSAYQNQYLNFEYIPVISGKGKKYVHVKASEDLDDASDTIILACGNPAMIEDAYALFVENTDDPVKEFLSDAFEPAISSTGKIEFQSEQMISLIVDQQVSQVMTGVSLLTALKEENHSILSVCGGKASCGMCAVIVDHKWWEKIDPPSKKEKNLIACLPATENNLRLACQIQLSSALDGLEISMPREILC